MRRLASRWSRQRWPTSTGWSPAAPRSTTAGHSYTADTLEFLSQQHPGASLFTIVGDDAAAKIETWERYEEVAARSTLVVVDRPGEPVELPAGFGWERVEVPRLEVSSTDLRDRCRDGRPLDYLVTEPVLRRHPLAGAVRGGRMSALARRPPQRTAIMLAANLLAVVALGGIGYAGVQGAEALRGRHQGRASSRSSCRSRRWACSATVDADDQLTSVTVFVLTAGSQLGGSIVTVPVSSDSTAWRSATTAFR